VCPEAAIHVDAEQLAREDILEFSSARPAGYDELFRLFVRRRSIRQFKDQPVPKEIIAKILEAAQQAPAGLPPSTVRAHVIDGKERVRSFAFDFLDETAKNSWMFSKIGIWAVRPFMSAQMHKEMREKIAPLYRGLIEGRKQGKDFLFYDAPLAMIFTAADDATDAVIACTYAMAAAESLGLGSCMIGTVNPMLPKMGSDFFDKYSLPRDSEHGLTIVFGYPDVTFRRAVRRRFASVVA
jgi:nitroreductase